MLISLSNWLVDSHEIKMLQYGKSVRESRTKPENNFIFCLCHVSFELLLSIPSYGIEREEEEEKYHFDKIIHFQLT